MWRHTIIGIRHSLICLVFILCSLSGKSELISQDLIVRGGWYFNTSREDFVRNTGIIVKNGRFMEIESKQNAENFSGLEILNLTDNDYILPGIIDLHAHYNVNLNSKRKDEYEVNPILQLANGVTLTFPAGEYDPEGMMEARKRIERGEQTGTRIFNTGPYFGQGWNRNEPVEEIYKAVDKWVENGVKGLKAKGINKIHLQALIERGHQHGLTITGHLGSGSRNSVNTKDAILMGIDRIEHFLGGDTTPPDKSAYSSIENLTPDHPGLQGIIEMFIKYKVYFDATMTAYGYYGDRKEGYDHWVDERKYLTPLARELTKDVRQSSEQFNKIYYVKRKTLKAFFDAGGEDLITLGTDHPSAGEYVSGFSAHRELDAFVLSGIPPAKAIKMATINGARALNVSEKFGSIETGKIADMFVIKGNPLENIRNTRTVHTVIKGGKVYNTKELLESVEGKLGPKTMEEAEIW